MTFSLKKLISTKSIWFVALSIVLGIILNGLLNWISTALGLPLFFDSIATAVVAALLGPLAGVITGLFTNLFLELIYGFPWIHYPFGLCGATTGLIIGIMANKHHFDTIAYVLLAVLLVTFFNSILGAIIATYVFGGITGVAFDYIVTGFLVAGNSFFSAAFWARIPANLIDKSIAVFIAFLIYTKFADINKKNYAAKRT